MNLLAPPKRAARKALRIARKLAKTSVRVAGEPSVLTYWWAKRRNFGDALSPLLIERLSGRRVEHVSAVFNWRHERVLMGVGSILENQPAHKQLVWGSGFLQPSSRFTRDANPANAAVGPDVRAVRGPLTRELILAQGFECPAVYGDPALLMPHIHNDPVEQTWELGLVPHYVDADTPFVHRLGASSGVRVIDVSLPPLTVVDQIRSCHVIAATSLHGLIVGIAYGIPVLWLELSTHVRGNGFKFRDFFGSIGAAVSSPLVPTDTTSALDLISQAQLHPVNLDLDALRLAFPYPEAQTV